MKHAMIDIETLGTGPDAVIKSIGAVDFDPESGLRGTDGLHLVIELNENDFKEGSVTDSTINFWMNQDATAKEIFRGDWTDVSLPIALWQLNRWFAQHGVEYVWAYGANFDPVILEYWYGKTLGTLGHHVPWKYNKVRCARTVLAIAGVSLKDYHNEIKHNALFDADTQAKALITAYEELGLLKEQDNVDSRTEEK